MGKKGKRKPLLQLFHEMQETREQTEEVPAKITIPQEEKDVCFRMKVGIHEYRVKMWRDGFRGIDVFDPNNDKLYALTFSEDGDGKFLEGWQMKGKEPYIINRKNFGTFAGRYSDHIQWFADNLDKGVCREVAELFTLSY